MYESLALLIDGQFIAEGRATIAVENPATGTELARLPVATTEDLDRALAAASRTFPAWRDTSAFERGQVLRRAAQIIRERADTIATTLTLEQGKPLAEARGEVLVSADIFDWAAEEARRVYGRIVPGRVPGVRQMVLHEAVGVAALFTPWNFPALTPARKLAAALAAGCTTILKAAEETPGTAIAFARALVDAGGHGQPGVRRSGGDFRAPDRAEGGAQGQLHRIDAGGQAPAAPLRRRGEAHDDGAWRQCARDRDRERRP